ncbi:MAG: Crp/Fnr family transcriptional regulator [Rhodospirillales bacterium]|nr:Crp/Fnr family transcriptional regulator [Rhodospirillales bacterium]
MKRRISRAEKIEALSKTRLFSALDSSDFDELAALSTTRHFDRDQMVFSRGDPGDALFVILDGRVGIRTLSAAGKEIFLNILEKGEAFGEIALLDGMARTAGAIAMEPTDLLVVGRERFMRFMECRPKLCIGVIMLLCSRVRWTSDIIEDAMFLEIRARLAKRLAKLASVYGTRQDDGLKIDIRLSQEELGRMLGATRESVNKEIAFLQTCGAINWRDGFVTIKDMDRLQDMAEGS